MDSEVNNKWQQFFMFTTIFRWFNCIQIHNYFYSRIIWSLTVTIHPNNCQYNTIDLWHPSQKTMHIAWGLCWSLGWTVASLYWPQCSLIYDLIASPNIKVNQNCILNQSNLLHCKQKEWLLDLNVICLWSIVEFRFINQFLFTVLSQWHLLK